MLKVERLKKIEEYLSRNEFVTIEELSQLLSVHKNTVRADINELAEKGIVEKKYGSIKYKSYNVPTTYDERTVINIEAKKIIGGLAASFLKEDDVIFVDGGTTASMLFYDQDILPQRLTVITNSLPVINQCIQNSNYTVYALPGKIDRQLNAFSSFETIDYARTYNIQKTFMSARGISESGDLSSGSLIDARIKAEILKNSCFSLLMAESDKLGRSAMINFAKIKDFNVWICDKYTPEVFDLAVKAGAKLICPHEPESLTQNIV